MSASRPIPTNLISGFLGAGKTTAILHLLRQKPADERWAVLVNEFGEIGVDGALLGNPDEVFIREVAGGCICCALAWRWGSFAPATSAPATTWPWRWVKATPAGCAGRPMTRAWRST